MKSKIRPRDFWTAAILLFLILLGVLLVVYTFTNTNRIREALATEVMQQQHDVESLITGYTDVLLALENHRLQAGAEARKRLLDALDHVQMQLDEMRSTYSFQRLDGAAKAHAFVKPVLEDAGHWLVEGVHNYGPSSPQLLLIVHTRLNERIESLRQISKETKFVANSLLEEQANDLASFRNSLLVQLAAFLAVSTGSIFLLLRQRNLQEQIARDQKENAQRFREFADIGADWFWETDVNLELVNDSRFSISEVPKLSSASKNASKNAGKNTGAQPSAVMDGNDSNYTSPVVKSPSGDLGKHLLPQEKMASRVPFTNVECKIQDSEDSFRDYSLSAKPILGEQGEFLGYRGIGRDISLRKSVERDLEAASMALVQAETRGREQAEEALKASEQFLRTTIDSLPQRIAILDNNGNIIETNRSWDIHEVKRPPRASKQGDSKESGSRRNIREFYQTQPEVINSDKAVQTEFSALVDALDSLVSAGGDSLVLEFTSGTGEQQRWYSLKAHQLETVESRYALLVYEEITSRKKLEEDDRRLRADLAHAARLSTAGELASGLAHELNQPLSAISHNCDAIQSMLQGEHATAYETSPELVETVNDIAGQTQRAGDIIRSMRQMVRKDTASHTETDLNRLVRETLRLTRPETREHDVKVLLDLDAHLPLLTVNPVQIQQVLVNLERNSVEAMVSAGIADKVLEISTHLQESQQILVTVMDSGPGFDNHVIDQLFTPFVSTKAEGMGLGLSISRSIVESHGGRLWVDRQSGKTRVRFSLPAAADLRFEQPAELIRLQG